MSNWAVTIEWPRGKTIKVYGEDESMLREHFEDAMNDLFKPKLNKMQELLYGDLLRALPREELKRVLKKNRGTGKTTAHAMKQIAEAIHNPNKTVKLFNDENGDVHAANVFYIRDIVQPMIEKLDLKFMVIRHAQQTLTFEI